MPAVLETLERRTMLSAYTYVVDKVFTGDGRHEALEVVGARRIAFIGCTFTNGSTDCRINRCRYVGFYRCEFRAMRGPADPDGSGLQLIDSGDVSVTRCTFEASPFASDLLSNYGDRPTAGVVTVRDCQFVGTGSADFTSSVCEDGGYAPPLDIYDTTIVGARCGISVACSVVSTHGVTFAGCQTDTYTARLYHRPARLLAA